MNYLLVFRSRYGQLTAVAVLFLCLLLIGMIWRADGPEETLRSIALPLGLAYFTWWIWAWPAVFASRQGITVRNQLKSYQIGWPDFERAESKFGLYLFVDEDAASHPPSASQADSADDGTVIRGRLESETAADDKEQQVARLLGTEDPPRRIYAAGVPARGGFTQSRDKTAPTLPELYFGRGPLVTLRVQPAIAARMLEEEKFYIENPNKRPLSHAADKNQVLLGRRRLGAPYLVLQDIKAKAGADNGTVTVPGANGSSGAVGKFVGIRSSVNWLQIGILALLVAGAVSYWAV